MRILLTGAQGQLGRHLKPLLTGHGELICVDREECDFTDKSATRALLNDIKPTLIVNPAAMTAVDLAEDEPQLADRLNHHLPEQLANWCAQNQSALIHYSTDYVFGGNQTHPWREDDPQTPQSVYGASKQAGEQAIMASGASALILRTAWLYSALPGNFLTAILNKAKAGEDLSVVFDQVGSPTWAQSLAEATDVLITQNHVPLSQTLCLHVVNHGAVSWHAFAQRAVSLAYQHGWIDREVKVKAVSSDEWPQKAKRPSGSVLDCSKYETLTGQSLASFDEALAKCLLQWSESLC